MKKIYTLHEYGSPSHFNGLEYLVNQNGMKLKHREFNLYRQLSSSIKRLNAIKFFVFWINLFFLITLPLSKNKKIVLAIAPYSNKLLLLQKLLKGHKVYYFTSYTCWDQTRMVHSRHYSSQLLSEWKSFTNTKVEYIFAVSKLTRDEMIANGFCHEDKIAIVNHSYRVNIEPLENNQKTNNFICVSTLSSHKGIEELLKIFKQLPDCKLTIVGRGPLECLVKETSKKHLNIIHAGYVESLENLIPIYKQNSFLLLNSRRNNSWEELFGIVIIEGMACGLIPITTDHPGPKEIITQYKNGVICAEGKIEEGIHFAINLSNNEFLEMKRNAIIRGHEYSCSNIAKRWGYILE